MGAVLPCPGDGDADRDAHNGESAPDGRGGVKRRLPFGCLDTSEPGAKKYAPRFPPKQTYMAHVLLYLARPNKHVSNYDSCNLSKSVQDRHVNCCDKYKTACTEICHGGI